MHPLKRKMENKHLSVIMFDAAYPPPVIGGKEKQAHLLASKLKGRGVNVRVISYRHNGNDTGDYEGVWVDRVDKGLKAVVGILYFLVKHRRKFNVLHIHTPSRIGKLVAFLGSTLSYKVVFKFPNEQMLDHQSVLGGIVWSTLISACRTLVVLEEDTDKKLRDRGISDGKIFNVPNGVTITKSCCQYHVNRTVDILFVGRLVPQKRCGDLIKACSLLPSESSSLWRLIIVGNGPQFEEMKSLVERQGLQGQVVFKGYCSNPIDYMRDADILVLPSDKEGMSNVILEAMSVGLPIVASEVGATKNQLGSFGEQFLVQPGDIQNISLQIGRLLNSPDLRQEYGAYLRQRCVDQFSINAVAEQYIKMYRKLN